MSEREPLVVFDIETIPDEAHHQGDEFAKLPFHQLVAISYLEARLVPTPDGPSYAINILRSGGDLQSTEEQLIQGMFRYIEQKKPRLVTFNGRGFDLPVLKYRALKYGVSAPWFARGESRFDNYSYRYGVDWHCDLMDALTDFGGSKAAKLSEICDLLGIPNKLGADGSQIEGLIAEGRLQEVRDYCESDVLSTYLLFLRYALFRGEMSEVGYCASIQNLKEFLESNGSERRNLQMFSSAWTAAC
jgi:predicted PolB exonuclease-like 3'-5' exonuclease